MGAIVDLSGDDRYEGGEFAQGCGYFLSMGILRDGAGRERSQPCCSEQLERFESCL